MFSQNHAGIKTLFRTLILGVLVSHWAVSQAGAVGSGSLSLSSGYYPLGTNLTVKAIPNYDSVFSSWLGNTNGATMIGTQITFTVTGSLSVTGLFSMAQFPLVVSTVRGTATPAGTTTNGYGTLITASVTSPVVNGATQYVAAGWSGTGSVGSSGVATNSMSFTLTNASSLAWLWQTNYQITASAGANGSISPSGNVYVPQGSNQSYAITPNPGYVITSVTVDGTNAGTAGSYTFTNVMTGHTVAAAFSPAPIQLTVTSAQSAPNPAGTTTNSYGSLINASVSSPVTNASGTEKYVLIGYVGTGSVGSGTNSSLSFTLTNNSTLVWQWQTKYWINLNIQGN